MLNYLEVPKFNLQDFIKVENMKINLPLEVSRQIYV